MLLDQQFARSDMALREMGYAALIQSLGYADALRFLVQTNPGQGSYLAWQEQLFGDASVDEIYEQARKHWERLDDDEAQQRIGRVPARNSCTANRDARPGTFIERPPT